MAKSTFTLGTATAATLNKICGRFFSGEVIAANRIFAAGSTNTMVCCKLVCYHRGLNIATDLLLTEFFLLLPAQQPPFRVSFQSDADEVAGGATAILSEIAVAPGGIVGFSLDYTQLDCV